MSRKACMAVVTASVISVVFATTARPETPIPGYCEENQVVSNNAAANAVEDQREYIRNVRMAGSGASCTVLLLAFGGADLGLTSLVCGLVTAATAISTSKPDNADALAREAYRKARDPRCLAPGLS